jgi:S-layer homology domain
LRIDLKNINTIAQGSVSNTMTQNKLKTNARFMGLLLGTALLSNSAAALAQSKGESTVAKPDDLKPAVAKGALDLFAANKSVNTAPQITGATPLKSTKKQPASSLVAQIAAPQAGDVNAPQGTETQPVAPPSGDTAAPKSDTKQPEKAPETQPVAPPSGDTAAPKSDTKQPEKAPEGQPVTPPSGDTAAPKADEKQPEKAPEGQPVTPPSGDTAAPKADEKQPEKAPESQPVTPPSGDTAAPKADEKSPDATTPGAKQQDGAATLSDISGNWAEPFIRVLTDKGIIAGYKDGTFRPDQPVTRAEFAALIRRAFPDAPEVSSKKTFRDVPPGYWAAEAISKASSIGFLAGDPGGTFRPADNIKRIESLVSLVNGTKLQPTGTAANIDELFSDTPQVPVFGRNALVAAAQRCLAVSVSYPEGRNFNPNGDSTRSDVAAFLHQSLVAAERLPKLPDDSPAQKYIVNCTPAPIAAKLTEPEVLGRVGIPAVPPVLEASAPAPVNAPVGGITTPSGFGANFGDLFIAAGYQNQIPTAGNGPGSADSVGLGAGIGLGDARNLIGLEASYSSSLGSNTRLLDRGGVNLKLHKLFGDNVSAAVGYENIFSSGYAPGTDPGNTLYGVLTGVLPLGDTSNFTASIGAGNGRFRQFSDIGTTSSVNKDSTNIFGSLGFRASENFALAADYNGRNFSIGLPITFKLGDNVGIQVTPSLLDIAGDSASPNSRFGIGGGIGIRF